MKISARNVQGNKGATTAPVKIDVGGIVVTSAITNAAMDELKLKPDQQAYTAIKASDVVIVAID